MATAKKAPAKKAPAKKVLAKSTVSKKAASPAKKAVAVKSTAPAEEGRGSTVKKAAGGVRQRRLHSPVKKAAAPAKKAAAPAKKAAAPVKKAAAPAKKAAAPAKKAAAPVKKAAARSRLPRRLLRRHHRHQEGGAPEEGRVSPNDDRHPRGEGRDQGRRRLHEGLRRQVPHRAASAADRRKGCAARPGCSSRGRGELADRRAGDGRRAVRRRGRRGRHDGRRARARSDAVGAEARQTIADIDTALSRLAIGSYGYSTESGRPIPRERLEAIPWATMLVEEKVGGIGRR